MKFRRLELIPISLGVFLIGTFLISFIVAVGLEHVRPDFPFISDTASLPPESSIFSQCVNLAFILMLVCVFLRYLHVDECSFVLGQRMSPRFNTIGSVLGALGCFGLDVVANFQEIHVLSVHLIGAVMCFSGGTLYACIQVYVSWKLYPEITKPHIFWIRAVLATICVIFTISTIIPAMVALQAFKGDSILKWRPEDGGWEPRLVGAVSEWLVALCYCLYFITFASEFKHMVLQDSLVRVELNSNTDIKRRESEGNMP